MDTKMLYFNQKQGNKETSKQRKESNMQDLNIINHIYSVELNLDSETLEVINKLSEVFNLDIIFSVKDSKRDVLEKINKLYPKKCLTHGYKRVIL